ncbi:hypothetical protein CPC08DRAFT_768936 [Agrocybe pediades]|nr:hypothetical protein CPC08DRAFT_768936 [Agrocybe pediades]
MPDLEHKQIEFTEFVGEYQGLKVFKPQLPLGAEWFYLGPVAVNFEKPVGSHQSGLIIRAEDPSALGDIADWEQVFVDIEGGEFSVWRPIPARPDEYVSGGDIFVQGMDKPTPDQTFGIKAIRTDLIGERVPNFLIKEIYLPKALVGFWTVLAIDRLHFATGAFRATGKEDVSELLIPAIRFNAWLGRATIPEFLFHEIRVPMLVTFYIFAAVDRLPRDDWSFGATTKEDISKLLIPAITKLPVFNEGAMRLKKGRSVGCTILKLEEELRNAGY